MFTGTTPQLSQRDDGFRVSDAAVERAIANVMSAPGKGRLVRLFSGGRIAAAIALILGVGVLLSEVTQPEPCVTFACQLEALSDEELGGMMDLMEEDGSLGPDEESWPNLY